MSETKSLRILHLEDDAHDAELIHRVLSREGLVDAVQVARSHSEFMAALDTGGFDVVLSDNQIAGVEGLGALQMVRRKYPGVPFLFVSGHLTDAGSIERLKAEGATDCVPKSELPTLAAAVRRAFGERGDKHAMQREAGYLAGMERLVTVVQELSLARDLATVMGIVRAAARALTGADGATFIMREGNMCYYADEDAIAPLWKGKRFPMTACISGWAMLNRQQAVIEDIYADARIPHDAYRPTFVKSLAMVPIRTQDPIGAIGNYWAAPHLASPEQVKLLQALADTTAVALENVQIYTELEQRVRDRTADLEATNKELGAFSFAVSHDLRAPLRHIDGFLEMLVEDCGDALNEQGQHYVKRIRSNTERMGRLIEDLLSLSRTTQTPVKRQKVDLSQMVRDITSELQATAPDRQADFIIAEGLSTYGDPGLLRVVMENLLLNAWKFTGKCPRARIEVGTIIAREGQTAYYVRDNGAGFNMAYASKLFGVFQRLHSQEEFPGSGVGLATVHRVIKKHGGRMWVEAVVNQGATFYFTLV